MRLQPRDLISGRSLDRLVGDLIGPLGLVAVVPLDLLVVFITDGRAHSFSVPH